MSRGLRYHSTEAMPQSLRERVQKAGAPKKDAKSSTPVRRSRVRKDEEHEEQVVFFNRIQTLAMNDKRYALASRSTHAIPNGGGRSKAEAGRLKAEGVKKGVSDVFCRLPAPGYHGLYIEMKKRVGGRTSKDQEQWIEESKLLGYRAQVCEGADEAFEVWINYVRRAIRAFSRCSG